MPLSSETIFWTRDFSAAAKAPHGLVFLADLDDPAICPLTQLAPTAEDFLRADIYGGAAKERFLARRAVLRRLLAGRLGCAAEAAVVAADGSGAPRLVAPKPVSPNAELFLSISGCGALAAFALAPRPIGIDIEILGLPEEVPTAMLHKAEAERLAPLDHAARHKAFLEIWTVKEAYLKARRTGLSREPAEIEVRFEDEDAIRLFDRGQPVATIVCACHNEALGGATIIAACVMV